MAAFHYQAIKKTGANIDGVIEADSERQARHKIKQMGLYPTQVEAIQKKSSKTNNTSLPSSDTWKDKNTGEKKEKVEWHRISVFNEGLVNVIQKYLKKGS